MSEVELTCEDRLEAANDRIKELEEALRKEIHFRTAREMQGTEIWLPVLDLISLFHKAYQLRNDAINNNKKHTRLIFSISNEGRITDVQAAEEEEKAQG